MIGDPCATPGCERPARFMSILEGNRYGNEAPWRCTVCCNAVADDEHVCTTPECGRSTWRRGRRGGRCEPCARAANVGRIIRRSNQMKETP